MCLVPTLGPTLARAVGRMEDIETTRPSCELTKFTVAATVAASVSGYIRVCVCVCPGMNVYPSPSTTGGQVFAIITAGVYQVITMYQARYKHLYMRDLIYFSQQSSGWLFLLDSFYK